MAVLKCDDGLVQLDKCPHCGFLVSWKDMQYELGKPVLCKWCRESMMKCPVCGSNDMIKTIILLDKTEGKFFIRGEVEALRAELKRLIHDNPIILVWPNIEITQVKEIPITDEITLTSQDE